MLSNSYADWVCTCPTIEDALCDPPYDGLNCSGCPYFLPAYADPYQEVSL